MRPLHAFVVALGEDLARQGVDRPELRLSVVSADLDLPVEARLTPEAGLELSLPRGRLATGFDPPSARVQLRFQAGEA